jgi:hypothetical protein
MSHPEPETLAAYHAGELTEPEERRLQDHLMGCPECAALLLDLDGLSDPGFGAGALAPAAQEALWRSLQSEIRKEEPKPAPVVPLRRLSTSPRWLPALAAALLAATIGLSIWVASLRRTVNELLQPQANTQFLTLTTDATRGEKGEPPRFEVRTGSRFFTLILNPAGQRRYERYRLEIVSADGRRVLPVDGLTPDPVSFLLVATVPRRALGSGTYRERLFGLDPGSAGGKELIVDRELYIPPE